jgi:hypothetical protein
MKNISIAHASISIPAKLYFGVDFVKQNLTNVKFYLTAVRPSMYIDKKTERSNRKEENHYDGRGPIRKASQEI